MDIKEYLSQVKALDDAINAKQQQILEMRKLSPRTVGILAVSDENSNARAQAERLVEKLAKHEEKLNAIIDEYVDKKEEIAAFIARLDDLQMRTLLERHYLSGDSWETVADKMYMSVRNVHYIHRRAIAILAEKPA